ncbi:MAG: alanine--tRNA ligase, partial [Halioglobus sp.]|nr:alanine--tRNA ligase [Halioglobus sp.]
EGSFFYKLVAPLERQMGAAYPELSRGRAQVEKVLRQEEERFAETLAKGMELLEGAIAALPAQISPQPASVAQTGTATRVIDGETVFKLYDTYGFPVDLTADVARERGLGIDQAGFEAAMAAQRERARAASRFGVDQRAVQLDVHSRFDGYGRTQGEGRVIALLADGQRVAALQPGERGEIVL